MSDLVSAETVREMLSWWEPGELAGRQNEVARDYGTIYAAAPDLARTVIAQAEQIARLQRAFEVVLGEANELAEETYNHMAGPFRPMTGRDYGLTPADMEEQ